MGLDMYLNKHTYVKNWEHTPPEERHQITVKKGGVDRTDIKLDRIKYIVEEVGYWRKANHIHKWFVDNIQEGNDDCGTYYVTSEQLRELYNLCKRIVDSLKDSPKKTIRINVGFSKENPNMQDLEVFTNTAIAEEHLPTQAGFFFGGTYYDEYYLSDLEETYKILKDILDDDHGYGDFYYHSSW